jgi:histidine ammonia-lyase
VVASQATRQRVQASRDALENLVAQGAVIYGVNTGMGGFVDHLVPIDKPTSFNRT